MPASLAHVTVDSSHAADLASFYAEILGRPVDSDANEFFATIGKTGDDPLPVTMMFVQVPEPRSGKNRIHADFHSATWRTEAERAIAAGATRVGDFDEYGVKWTTLADPEGNLFDIGSG